MARFVNSYSVALVPNRRKGSQVLPLPYTELTEIDH